MIGSIAEGQGRPTTESCHYGDPVGKGKEAVGNGSVTVGNGGIVTVGIARVVVGNGGIVTVGTARVAGGIVGIITVGTGKVGKRDGIAVGVLVDNCAEEVGGTSVFDGTMGGCLVGVDCIGVLESEVIVLVGIPGMNVDVAFNVAVAKPVDSDVVVPDWTNEAVGEGVPIFKTDSILSKGTPREGVLSLSCCISVKIFRWIGGILVEKGSAL